MYLPVSLSDCERERDRDTCKYSDAPRKFYTAVKQMSYKMYHTFQCSVEYKAYIWNTTTSLCLYIVVGAGSHSTLDFTCKMNPQKKLPNQIKVSCFYCLRCLFIYRYFCIHQFYLNVNIQAWNY